MWPFNTGEKLVSRIKKMPLSPPAYAVLKDSQNQAKCCCRNVVELDHILIALLMPENPESAKAFRQAQPRVPDAVVIGNLAYTTLVGHLLDASQRMAEAGGSPQIELNHLWDAVTELVPDAAKNRR